MGNNAYELGYDQYLLMNQFNADNLTSGESGLFGSVTSGAPLSAAMVNSLLPEGGIDLKKTNLAEFVTGENIQSSNFVSGSTGWQIKGNGDVEFNNGTFRGALTAATIDIGGSDATSFHVDINGNIWAGAATFAAAPFSVSSAGVLTATSGVFSGTIAVGFGNNLVPNSSFESWDSASPSTLVGWTSSDVWGTDILASATSYFGATSLRMVGKVSTIGVTISADEFVKDGKYYLYSIYIRQTGATTGTYLIDLYGNGGLVDTAGMTGSLTGLSSGVWTRLTISIPETIATVPSDLVLRILTDANVGCDVFFDGLLFEEVSGTSVTSAGMWSESAQTVIQGDRITTGIINAVQVRTSLSGARVVIFPDANTGILAEDASGNDVFKVLIGGTDTGDVIMGQEDTGYYAKWDKSVAKFLINGQEASTIKDFSNALFNQVVFLGSYNDGLLQSGAGVGRLLGTTQVASGVSSTAWLYATDSIVHNNITAAGTGDSWSSPVTWEFTVSFVVQSAVTQDVFIGLNNTYPVGAVPANATSTARHIGFFIEDGTIYASNADNTTQTRTSIAASVTLTNLTSYRFVYTVGTNIKFYVKTASAADYTLAATHTTNMPTGTSSPPTIAMGITDTGGVATKLFVVTNNYSVKVTL